MPRYKYQPPAERGPVVVVVIGVGLAVVVVVVGVAVGAYYLGTRSGSKVTADAGKSVPADTTDAKDTKPQKVTPEKPPEPAPVLLPPVPEPAVPLMPVPTMSEPVPVPEPAKPLTFEQALARVPEYAKDARAAFVREWPDRAKKLAADDRREFEEIRTRAEARGRNGITAGELAARG